MQKMKKVSNDAKYFSEKDDDNFNFPYIIIGDRTTILV